MKRCKCGSELANNARVCPHCGHRYTRPFVLFLAICFGALIVLMFVEAIRKQGTTEGPSRSQPEATAGVTDDAELLISRCGRPDRDVSTVSTENDDPKPPIPSRLITYRKAHLKFGYVPGDTGRWKFIGLIDTRTNKAITAAQLEAVLRSRLPCSIAPGR